MRIGREERKRLVSERTRSRREERTSSPLLQLFHQKVKSFDVHLDRSVYYASRSKKNSRLRPSSKRKRGEIVSSSVDELSFFAEEMFPSSPKSRDLCTEVYLRFSYHLKGLVNSYDFESLR